MIPDYDMIDTKVDSINVIKDKVAAIKKLVANGTITNEEYEAEKKRVESELAGNISEIIFGDES